MFAVFSHFVNYVYNSIDARDLEIFSNDPESIFWLCPPTNVQKYLKACALSEENSPLNTVTGRLQRIIKIGMDAGAVKLFNKRSPAAAAERNRERISWWSSSSWWRERDREAQKHYYHQRTTALAKRIILATE